MWKQRLYSTKSEMTVSTWEPDLDTGSNYMEPVMIGVLRSPLEENYYGLVAVSSMIHMPYTCQLLTESLEMTLAHIQTSSKEAQEKWKKKKITSGPA